MAGVACEAMSGDATAEREIGALEIATRSGAVIVRARAIERPEVLSGPAEIQPDGVVRAGFSGRIEIACPEGTDVIIGSSSGRNATPVARPRVHDLRHAPWRADARRALSRRAGGHIRRQSR